MAVSSELKRSSSGLPAALDRNARRGAALRDQAERFILDRRLHKRRAPGMACLSALHEATTCGKLARNGSKGCGTIMRVAPIGLMGWDTESIESIALESSALTHGHRTAQDAAAAWALLLTAVQDGEEVEDAAGRLAHRFGPETSAAIEGALAAPRDGLPETVESLGGGWVAEEALAIALYAVLASDTFVDGLRIAVTHSGDSDSTGAIAGNLLGPIYPEETMAHPWRREIECVDLIDRLARDLATAARGGSGIDELVARYPGW